MHKKVYELSWSSLDFYFDKAVELIPSDDRVVTSSYIRILTIS